MKKVIVVCFFSFLLILFCQIDSGLAVVCSPACKDTEFCIGPTDDKGVSLEPPTCVVKYNDGGACDNGSQCQLGICTKGRCGTNSEQATFDAVKKALGNFPKELKFTDVDDDPYQIIGGVIKAFLGIIGILALLIFIYGGIMWMTAGGTEQTVSKAQKTMVWAALGLFAIFVSYAAIGYAINALRF